MPATDLLCARRPDNAYDRLSLVDMDFRSGFLESYRTERRPAARLEYVLAVARTFLTITGFLAIYFDPNEPHRLAQITYAVLIGYAVYSTILLILVRRASAVSRTHIR